MADSIISYNEFKRLRSVSKVRAGIDDTTAMTLLRCLPANYSISIHLWMWVWMLSIPGFLVITIFFKWWVGLLLLFFVTPSIKAGSKTTASKFVLEYAEKNEDFYNLLNDNDVLFFEFED